MQQTKAKHETAQELAARFEYWGEHPTFTVGEWKYLVSNDDTRQSYWEWVASALEGE